MKKLLLSLLCLVAFLPAFADELTLDYTGTDATKYGMTRLSGSTSDYNPNPCTLTGTGDVVTVKFTGNTRLWGNGTFRFYKGSSVEFSVPSNYKITKIEFLNSNDNAITAQSFALPTGGAGTWSAGVWTGDAASVKINCTKTSGNQEVAKMKVTYSVAAANTVAAPTFSKDAGKFSEPFELTLSCATEGAQIYYTTDGTEPAAVLGDMYAGGIDIPAETTTVKAFAVKDGMTSSEVVTKTYTYFNNKCANIAEWLTKAAADKTNVYEITGEVTVSYNANTKADGTGYQYTYVQDATGSLLVYAVKNNHTPGQTLTGLKGDYADYKNLIEMTNSNVAILTPGTGTAPQPEVTAISAITASDMNKYVKVSKATFDPTAKTLTQGTDNIALYYRFAGVDVPTEAGEYDVEGFVCVYETDLQLYPTKFTQAGLLEPEILAFKSTDFAQVTDNEEIEPADTPISLEVDNPNAGTTMTVYVMKAPSADDLDNLDEFDSVEDFTGTEWVCKKTIKDPGYYYISAMVMDASGNDSYAEFHFTIKGDVVTKLMNPIVSFTAGENDDEVETGGTAEAPVTLHIENYAYNNSKIYYFITTAAEDPEYIVSEENVEDVIEEAGEYRFKAYVASYQGEKLTGMSDIVEGTITVTPAPVKVPTFAATDKEGAAVENGGTVAEDKAPVTVVITNPFPGEDMFVSVMNLSTGSSTDHETTEATYTVTLDESAEWAMGAMQFVNGNESYAEFSCTIEGEVRYNLYPPYVEFLDADDNEVESPAKQLPIRMVISNQNYYEGVKMVYTINGEETETDENSVEIEITQPGKITYSVYCKMGTKSESQKVEGTYEIEASAAKLAAPEITFTTPEGETVPVTCTITNPNLNGYGTIVYAVGTSQWFESDEATVTFVLPSDGTYTVKAYVRNNENEELNSDVTEKQYEQVGVDGISFGTEGVTVRGGEIIVPEGAEIYNLSGIRMADGRVAPGIYIVRTAGKAVKVTVK